MSQARQAAPARAVKRLVDVLGAGTLMLVLSPIEAAVAVAVRIRMGKPVLFTQERPGLHERSFKVWKFRTMTSERDSQGALLPDAMRLTPLGRVLRATSLDELPQLINIIAGDMSFIGPRPLLMRYLPYFTDRERLRFAVRPGITGWAQINGRNFVHWDERLALDVWYVEHWSLAVDVRIALKTIRLVLSGRDVAGDPEATMLNLDDERRSRVPRPI